MLASDWLVCLGKRVPIDDVKMKNPYTVLATIPVCLMAKSCLGKYWKTLQQEDDYQNHVITLIV